MLLGSTNNLGWDLMKVLYETNNKTTIIVHSSTALGHPATQNALRERYGVKMFVDYESEQKLMSELQQFVSGWKGN